MTDRSAAAGSGIHRLLDELFAGIDSTPETQDLKEEVRSNLLARATELEAAGSSPHDAAQQAVEELGDLGELIGAAPAAPPGADAAPGWQSAWLRHRVRPRPAFVGRVAIAASAAALGLVLAALGATGVLPLPIGAVLGLLGWSAAGIAWIVGDSLVQETTMHHPMPASRAGGYFLATLLGVIGLGLGALVLLGALPGWAVVFVALGTVAAIALFAFLGATQTNRRKAWVRALLRDHEQWQPSGRSRFEQEPETAARFGIYTAVLWILALAAFVLIGVLLGWAWSWLALLGGLVVMLLLLARMLFGSR